MIIFYFNNTVITNWMVFSADTEFSKVFSEEPNSVNKARKNYLPESIGEAVEVINILFTMAISFKNNVKKPITKTYVARPGSSPITYTVFI